MIIVGIALAAVVVLFVLAWVVVGLAFKLLWWAIIGIVTMALVAGIATLGVESLVRSRGGTPREVRQNKPYRGQVGLPPAPAPAAISTARRRRP